MTTVAFILMYYVICKNLNYFDFYHKNYFVFKVFNITTETVAITYLVVVS